MASAAKRWNLSSTAAHLWGSYMSGSVLLSSLFKGEERVKVQVRDAGIIQELYAESLHCGETRGYIQQATTPVPGKEKDDHPTSTGLLTVQKMLYGAATPYETTVVATGDATTDWLEYFSASEQNDTQLVLSSSDSFCGGILAQKLPSRSPTSRAEAEAAPSLPQVLPLRPLMHRLERVPFTTTLEIAQELLGQAVLDPKAMKLIPLDFFCRCSKHAAVASLLKNYPEEEATAFLATEDQVSTCVFCNTSHVLTR